MQTGSETIICSRCGAENPAQRKTCQRCWGLLRGPICPHCGKRATRAGARFCEHCDGDLRAEPAVRESRVEVPSEPAVPAGGLPAQEPRALELPAIEPSAIEQAPVEQPAVERPLDDPHVHPPAAAPQPVAPERFVARGLSRTSAAEEKQERPTPQPADARPAGARPADTRSAHQQKPRFGVRRRPIGLFIAAAGLAIIVGLAFLGGVALRRQRAATDVTAVGDSQRGVSPAPRVAATTANPVVVPSATPSVSPATQPAAGGTLRITTDPSGAEVELDGVAVGVTALTLSGVAPGRRMVRVSRSGFRAESRELEITAGETTTLHLTLSATLAPVTPRRRAPSGPPLPPPPLPPPP